MTETVIAFSYLGHAYRPGTWVFRNYSALVKEGHVFALPGPNGRGKTTLLKILLGSLKPAEATLSVKGHDAEYDNGNFLQMAALKSALSIVCTWHVLIEETTWYVGDFTKQLMIYKNAIRSHSLWTSAVYYRIFIAEDFSLMSGSKLTLLSRPPASRRFLFQQSLTAYRHRFLSLRTFCAAVSIFFGGVGLA